MEAGTAMIRTAGRGKRSAAGKPLPVRPRPPDLRDPKVRARLAADARTVRDHPSTAEGDAFIEVALAEVEGWES